MTEPARRSYLGFWDDTGRRFPSLAGAPSTRYYRDCEITLFSETLSAARELLDSAQPLLVTATAEWLADAEEPRLTASGLEPLDQAAAQSSSGLRVFVDSPDPLGSVKSLLDREGDGRGQVVLVLDLDRAVEAEFELPRRFRLTAGIRQAIKAIPGVRIQEL